MAPGLPPPLYYYNTHFDATLTVKLGMSDESDDSAVCTKSAKYSWCLYTKFLTFLPQPSLCRTP